MVFLKQIDFRLMGKHEIFIELVHLMSKLYGWYFLLAGIFKVFIGILFTDKLKEMFIERLLEIPPNSIGYMYLSAFAIPCSFPIAWILTIGEINVGLCFIKSTNFLYANLAAIFIIINIGLGGYSSLTLLLFLFLPILLLILRVSEKYQPMMRTKFFF